ncbi:MAG: hypothetical protein ACM3KT_02250 [Deltaproteobacteria bacterium]
MEIISSKQTFFVKRMFPILWLGIIGLAVAMPFLVPPKAKNPAVHAPPPEIFMIVPAMMLGMGVLLFRKLIWDLADKVEDFGDYLRVRRGDIEERVNLVDVMNVSMSQFTNPKRITLRLRKPGAFGDEVAFIPQAPVFRLNPFARNAIAERLIRRIDQLRNNGASR